MTKIKTLSAEEMSLQIHRALAPQDCRNLMSRYILWHSALRHIEYVEQCWVKRDDCVFEAPWGRYEGWQGVWDCYVKDHGDRSDPEAYEKMKGVMWAHHLDTECLVVSDDGLTARGTWWSPGHETFAVDDAVWAYSKYSADFIFEDGRWWIWKMYLYPWFKADYYTCWTKFPQLSPDEFREETGYTTCKKSEMDFYVWGPDKVYPPDQPEPPVPFATYSDLK